MDKRTQKNPILFIGDFRRKQTSDYFLEMESQLLSKSMEISRFGVYPLIFFLWQTSKPAIVLGVGQKSEEEVHLDSCNVNGVTIFKRRSGGGAVLHGQGNICYTLILPLDLKRGLRDIPKSFQLIGDILIQALRNLGLDARFKPLSDIVIAPGNDAHDARAMKISGNAQWRRKDYLLHHGTILMDMDLPLVEKILKEPQKRPDYRGVRTHRDFIINLKSFGITETEFLKKFILQGAKFFELSEDMEEIQSFVNKVRIENHVWTWVKGQCPSFPSSSKLELELGKMDLSHWRIP